MNIRLNRTHNDRLINNGVNTVEEFDVEPKDLNHEMIGWEWQESVFDEITGHLVIHVWDKSEPEDYIEQLED